MVKPIIGIVSNQEYIYRGNFKKKVLDVNLDYINMLISSGAIPIVIPYGNDISDIKRILTIIDGLLLIGGEDIDEGCYNLPSVKGSERDNFEIEIYKYCKKNKKPILGICRGMQLINVAENGTLKNVEDSCINHFIEEDGWINYHKINIMKNTLLNKILSLDEYIMSSVHHQQIDKLGENLKISSLAEDGVIEAIESTTDELVIGVQGHIEKCLSNFNEYKKLIDFFVKEVKNGIK